MIDGFRADAASTDITEHIFQRSEHSPFVTAPEPFTNAVVEWLGSH